MASCEAPSSLTPERCGLPHLRCPWMVEMSLPGIPITYISHDNVSTCFLPSSLLYNKYACGVIKIDFSVEYARMYG